MSLFSIPNIAENIRRIAVLNWKGGCGKSMLSANLASYYAAKGIQSVLIDHDPQGASLHWLNQRNGQGQHPLIHGINATARPNHLTRSFSMRLPPNAERVIIDTPAGLRGADLQELVRETDSIVIPVLPSDADIHAAASFIAELLLDARVKLSGTRVAVVANRVRHNTVIYHALDRFLKKLQFPLIATLRDSQAYVRAAEQGLGIHEMQPPSQVRREREQWRHIVGWLEQSATNSNRQSAPTPGLAPERMLISSPPERRSCRVW